MMISGPISPIPSNQNYPADSVEAVIIPPDRAYIYKLPVKYDVNGNVLKQTWRDVFKKPSVNYFDYLTRLFTKHLERKELFAAQQVLSAVYQYIGPTPSLETKQQMHGKLLDAYIERNKMQIDPETLRILVNRTAERLITDCSTKLEIIAALFEKFETSLRENLKQALPTFPLVLQTTVLTYLPLPVSPLALFLAPSITLALVTLLEDDPLRNAIIQQRALSTFPQAIAQETQSQEPVEDFLATETSYALRAAFVVKSQKAAAEALKQAAAPAAKALKQPPAVTMRIVQKPLQPLYRNRYGSFSETDSDAD